MAGATARLVTLHLLCLALAGGSLGQQSAGQRDAAAAAAPPPGLACSALVDTDAPERELRAATRFQILACTSAPCLISTG